MNQTVGSETLSVAEQIRQSVEKGELSLPPLPELATRLMDLLEKGDDVNPKQLAELIESEPAVAASLLRTANSVFFAGLNPISDLDEAVARLGLRQVSSVVTAVVHKGNFISKDPHKMELLHRLWEEAVACAMGGRRLASMGGDDPGEAFLAGLLHDTGKLLVLKGVDELSARSDSLAFTPVVVNELMTLLNPVLGYHTLIEWRIAEPICRVALHHHDREIDSGETLILRIQAADAIARKLGTHSHPEPDLILIEEPSIERLNIGDLELAALMVDLEDEIARIRGLL